MAAVEFTTDHLERIARTEQVAATALEQSSKLEDVVVQIRVDAAKDRVKLAAIVAGASLLVTSLVTATTGLLLKNALEHDDHSVPTQAQTASPTTP